MASSNVQRFVTTEQSSSATLTTEDGNPFPVNVLPSDAGLPGQYTFVYRPGGAASGNVYNDFSALYSALDASCPAGPSGTRSPSLILIDTSLIAFAPAPLPPRTGGAAYNLNNSTWQAVADPISGSAGAEVVWQEGTTIDGGSATADLVISLRGNIEFTNDTTNDVITCAHAGQVVVINMEQNSNLQSDAAGRMIKATNGAAFVFMALDSTIGDGTVATLEAVAPGVALVQAFGNSFVGGLATIGTAVFWDFAAPGVQGAGSTVTAVACSNGSVLLANGANQNVPITFGFGAPVRVRNFLRIDGPTAPYSIGGIACDGGNRGGQKVAFWSAVAHPLSLTFSDAGSLAANRIYAGVAGPLLVGGSAVSFEVTYDSNLPGWVLTNVVSDNSIAANHAQGNTANAVAANPVLSPTIAFTCLGPAKKVHVEVSCYPINNTGSNEIPATMTLLLDGAPIGGVPTPASAFINSAPLGSPFGGPITLTWDVTFPDNAAHTLGIQVATSGGNLSLGAGTIHAQELLA